MIVEVRKRSQSRGPSSKMGSRTNSTLDFRSSQTDFRSQGSGSKMDLDSLRSSLAASRSSVVGPEVETKVAVKVASYVV